MHSPILPFLSVITPLPVWTSYGSSSSCWLTFKPSHCWRRERSHVRASKRSDPFWDSNAESFRTSRFRGGLLDDDEEEDDFSQRERSWWSSIDSREAIDDEYDGFDEIPDQQQPWDRFWIVKVFKSFGWMMPAVMISMLLATGPKALLMALALPLGQSALSLAIEKVWGKPSAAPKPKSKPPKRRPFTSKATNNTVRQQQQGEDDEEQWGYQSWVAREDGAVEKGPQRGGPDFGGWDELDRRDKFGKGPTKPRSWKTSRPRPVGGTKGKVTKRSSRDGDVPLLMRLLIAVFPFLGSWTRIL